MIVKWAKWIGLGVGLAACSAAVFWLLVQWPIVFVCVLGSGVGLALIAYWVGVFEEHRREVSDNVRQPTAEPEPVPVEVRPC